MSWKGFKKALERMPHQLQSKIGRGAKTVDPDFDDLKLRFVDLEGVTKSLFMSASQFRDSIRETLVYQVAFMEQILATYRPITTDPEGVAQPTGTYIDEGASPELLRVAEEFRDRVNEIKAKIDPQLEALDISVVGPIQELMAMMKNIHRVIQKRDHKLIDYDRHKSQVEKYEAKEGVDGGRSLPDEQAYQKYGAQYQEASRQYNYYNDMLKAELKQLLDLRQAFIDPIFMKFFRIQRQLYSDLFHEFSQAARNCPAFDLTTPVITGWQQKWPRAEHTLSAIDLWGQGFMQVEPYKIDDKGKGFVGSIKGTFRKKEKSATPTASSAFSQGPSTPYSGQQYGQGSASHSNTFSPASGASPYAAESPAEKQTPYGAYQPPYMKEPGQAYPPVGQAGSAALASSSAASGPSNLPPPAYEAIAGAAPPVHEKTPPAGARAAASPGVLYVVAIYDYIAQADGDLSFREGDRIELIQRTEAKDDWWTGRLNGVTGVFPGTYVSDP
ncbi:BAR-domain-containing protein [Martensiomyces pterosporus]|nr:BAR-domain-containing protein [Martensiomyces pterosporus]